MSWNVEQSRSQEKRDAGCFGIRNGYIRESVGVVGIRDNMREHWLWRFGHVSSETDADLVRTTMGLKEEKIQNDIGDVGKDGAELTTYRTDKRVWKVAIHQPELSLGGGYGL